MTIPACQTACHQNSYSIAGLSYSQECWCDNSFKIMVPLSLEMAVTCHARVTERRIVVAAIVLTYIAIQDQALSISRRRPLSLPLQEHLREQRLVAVSGSTTTTIPSARPTAYVGNWTYQGCYIDNAYGRVLPIFAPSPDDTTVDSCISYCTAQGYNVPVLSTAHNAFAAVCL